MRYVPNEDQATFLSVLEQMMEPKKAGWKVSPDWSRFDWDGEFDAALEENGFFDCAAEETLGLVSAAAMVHRLASLPCLVEGTASAMLRPLYAPGLPRPLAVVEGDPESAIPFLPVARSLIVIGREDVRAARLPSDSVERVESLFAYPMGRLRFPLDWIPLDVDPENVRDTWRVGIAAEISGVLKGGLDAVVAHVRDRHQFGRPLGSFQAIQHRLAGAAVKIEGAYWLALKAAQGLDGADPATALGYAQDISSAIIYDLHQFMGAMGLTLEHPLHRWTYRARFLRSALGGASANLDTVAEKRWRAA